MRQFSLGYNQGRGVLMPSLAKYLSNIDHDLLSRIARHWEVEYEAAEWKEIEAALLSNMTTKAVLDERIAELPVPAREAWDALMGQTGKIPWSEFAMKYGSPRDLGPAARQREAPDLHPANVTETLLYRGLIGRAFLDAAPEPREFAFIADELTALYAKPSKKSLSPVIRPVLPAEIGRQQPANTRILDHATDWLARKRMGQALPNNYFSNAQISAQFMGAMLSETGLLTTTRELNLEAIGPFLQADRLSTLKEWFAAWRSSDNLNDLLMTPGLEFEGAWRNDPVFSRQAILAQLSGFDVNTWYSLSAFAAHIKTSMPDFLRPAGDFDSWSIRKASSREYLVGRKHWDDVDGAYLHYLFTGPLHWLGVVDLAYTAKETQPAAFRLSPLSGFLLGETAPAPVLALESSPKLLSDLTIILPVNSSRPLRYQAGRFTTIVGNSPHETRLQVSAASLTVAEEGGLKVDQLLQLLERTLKAPLPASFKKLAKRWDQRRVEVRVEKATLLRVEDPQVLSLLRETPRLQRLIREELTQNVVLIDPAGVELIKKALLEAGILSQIELDV
jgi:hypothetical protein